MIDIDKIVNELTLEEKISLLSGFNSWYTNKIERLDIPSIKMSDGPMALEVTVIPENHLPAFLAQSLWALHGMKTYFWKLEKP